MAPDVAVSSIGLKRLLGRWPQGQGEGGVPKAPDSPSPKRSRVNKASVSLILQLCGTAALGWWGVWGWLFYNRQRGGNRQSDFPCLVCESGISASSPGSRIRKWGTGRGGGNTGTQGRILFNLALPVPNAFSVNVSLVEEWRQPTSSGLSFREMAILRM